MAVGQCGGLGADVGWGERIRWRWVHCARIQVTQSNEPYSWGGGIQSALSSHILGG